MTSRGDIAGASAGIAIVGAAEVDGTTEIAAGPQVSAPARRRRLRTMVVWAGIGNAGYLASQYAMLMVAAKLGGRTTAGQFALAHAIVAPLIVVSQMQFRQLQVTDVAETVRFMDFFKTRVFVTVLVVFLSLLWSWGWGVGEGSADVLVLIVLLTAIGKGFESISDVCHGALQRRELLDHMAMSLIVRGGLSLLSFGAVLAATNSLPAALAAVAVVCALMLVVDIGLVRASTPCSLSRVDSGGKTSIRRLAVLAWPLTLSAALLTLASNIPRYVLEWLRDTDSVAIYAVAMMPISLAGLFTGAVSQAAMARAASYYHYGERVAFRRLALRIQAVSLAAGATMLVASLLAGPQLVRLFFTAEFSEAAPVMVLLAAGTTIAAIGAFGATTLVAARRFWPQLVNAGLSLAIQMPLCYLLVRRGGAIGAGFAELLRYGVAGAFLALVGWWVYRAHDWNEGSSSHLRRT